MENLNSESLFPDEDSRESSTDTTQPVRRVPLPASALHGIGHEGAKAPKFEDLFTVEKQRREITEHHEHHKDKDDEKEDKDDTSVEPTGHARLARELPFHKLTSLEIPEHIAAGETPSKPASVESTPQIHPEMTDEEIQQVVEVSLQDLQKLDVEHEPQALDPSVAHAEAIAYEPSAELPLPKPAQSAEHMQPVASAENADHAADFAAWEAEMAAYQNVEGTHQSEDYTPPEQAGTGGGGNRPPVPPFGASGEMPGSSPHPENEGESFAQEASAHDSAPYERPRSSLMDKLAVPLAAAEMLHINNKLQRAELARMRGDTVVGMVAGWALLRSFRDRTMIRRHKQEADDQFTAQQKLNQQTAAQQNQLTQQQQRLVRAQQQQAAQPATPNRFRPGTAGGQNMNALPVIPAAQQNMNAQPGITVANPNQAPAAATANQNNQNQANKKTNASGNIVPVPVPIVAPHLRRKNSPEAAKAEQVEAERARLAQAQQEEAIRQETLDNLPQNHEIVRSSWHSIERDKTTGKVVEKPTSFEYGAALQRELKSEQLQDRIADDAQKTQQSGSGGAPIAGPGSAVGGAFGSPTAQQRAMGQAILSNMPMPPLEGQRAAQKTTAQQIASAPSSPWFWVALIFLLIVFFAAAWF